MKLSKTKWAIIIIIIILALLYFTAPDNGGEVDLSGDNEAAAGLCQDINRYESCLVAGNEKGDCRELYCDDNAPSSCSWYDVFCRIAPWFN